MNVYVKDPQQPAQACMIWMHGLGADANDMVGVANQLRLTAPVRHVFMDAPVRNVTINNHMPMRAWYDIVGTTLTSREDREGILQSQGLIQNVINQQIEAGFQSSQIFLAGFSQGGAMALFSAVNSQAPLAGVIALSAYLPLFSECQSILHKETPVFMAEGRFDPIVLPDWTASACRWLRSSGFEHVAYHQYPMEHSICVEEIRDLVSWLNSKLSRMAQSNGVTS